MRGNSKINHRPYFPPICSQAIKSPYICRLAPYDCGFEFEWFDHHCTGTHTLYYGMRGSKDKRSLPISNTVVNIDHLKTDCDYEFYIENEEGRKSNIRLVRTGAIPNGTTVINYLHPEDTQYDFSGKYLCSPSIARTKTGKLIASMDIYGPEMAQNLTVMFYSDDDGSHWHYLTDLYPFYWGSLFYHNDVLYILGLTTEYGNLQIACSKDEGKTWSEPVTLFFGSNVLCNYGGMHRAPMHLTLYNGRFYTSCEYGCWKSGSHLPAILSIDENVDFMTAGNWVCSDFLPFEGEWKKVACTQGDTMEGNIVLAPDGNLYNILRWKIGSMLKLRVNTDDIEAPPIFEDITEAPVSNSMFRIIPCDGKFILVTNRKTEVSAKHDVWSYRNVLSVYTSYNLKSFTFLRDIINYENEDAAKIGFQYPAFLNEDGYISLAIRAAFNHADSFHNSNYILFCKMKI